MFDNLSDPFSHYRKGDYTFTCDICGQKCWASQGTVLDAATGRGGAFVCPECSDPIDYGLVPYKIPAEAIIPISRDGFQSADPMSVCNQYPPWNVEQYNWNVPPFIPILPCHTWDGIDMAQWDAWILAWDDTSCYDGGTNINC